jgi:hypothetical protein
MSVGPSGYVYKEVLIFVVRCVLGLMIDLQRGKLQLVRTPRSDYKVDKVYHKVYPQFGNKMLINF